MKRGVVILALACALPGAVDADEIGGDWCADDGRNVRIEFSRIRTPGGVWIDGEYERHSYVFVIPEGETDAGTRVEMQQWSEQEVSVTYEGQEPESWHRCQMTS